MRDESVVDAIERLRIENYRRRLDLTRAVASSATNEQTEPTDDRALIPAPLADERDS